MTLTMQQRQENSLCLHLVNKSSQIVILKLKII